MYRMGEQALPVARDMLTSELWTERKAAAALLRQWHVAAPELSDLAQHDPHPAVKHASRWHPAVVAASQVYSARPKRVGG